ncbi:hypothetical protein SAMN06266956_3083 [Paraburkholderia hospita]|nr:hypothetical protein SAMN06266956_3083 [Paraburkholderia hospita]
MQPNPAGHPTFSIRLNQASATTVQAASIALQQHFSPDGDAQPPMLELVRFEAAMLELKTARAEFDTLFTFGATWQQGQTCVRSLQG